MISLFREEYTHLKAKIPLLEEVLIVEKTADIVIIGGGIIGVSIAYNLCKRGVDVTVLEQGTIGSQASGAAAGLLAPLGPLSGPGLYADLLLSSFAMFPSLVSELEEASGIHLGYEQIGALRTIHNPKRIAHLRKRMKDWEALGLTMHWLSGDEARQLEPLLSPGVCAAIYAPEEAQICAPQLVKAFSKAATRSGARIYSHVEIAGIQHHHNTITGVHTSQGETIARNHLW